MVLAAIDLAEQSATTCFMDAGRLVLQVPMGASPMVLPTAASVAIHSAVQARTKNSPGEKEHKAA
ncbi:hypothetical protein I1E95_07725 [Synechococcus sp. CBW1107]|uniref:hypothetical protein n=1 Tax=Synechococcus sp. CBW1107 TaxID=2789857 RepID=UPI0018CCFBCE|nr:hypothetical protein [Synechococcus sp. CBW1107]QPN57921.1 hypothetical protein I1E95_07725 [Synechococcus sp. CBW1107]